MSLWTPSYALPIRALLIALAAGIIAPMLLIGAWGIYAVSQSERARAEAGVVTLVEALASNVERQLIAYRDLALSLARARHLLDNDLVVFESIARDMATRAGVTLVLVNEQGQQLINSDAAPGAALPRSQHWEKLAAIFEGGKPFVSNLRSNTGGNELTFAVLVPTTTNSGVRYVLSLAPRRSVLSELVTQAGIPADWLAALHDRDNRFLARSISEDKFVGERAPFWDSIHAPSGMLQTTDREGRASVLAFTTVPFGGWRAIVWAPKAVLYASSRALMWWGLSALAVGLAASLTLAFLFARQIERLIADLNRAATALGAGQPVTMPPTYLEEARSIGAALSTAAGQIADREVALKAAAERSNHLLHEIAHRLKNQLALIGAVVRQSGRTSEDFGTFSEHLEKRLQALGQSTTLLVASDWKHTQLKDLIAAQLESFSGLGSITVSGPDVRIGANVTQYLGIALHELATNAAKYGALSSPEGRLAITWTVEDGRLRLCWQETGGPRVTQPTRTGFGHLVVGRLISSALQAETKSEFLETGLRWQIDMPLAA